MWLWERFHSGFLLCFFSSCEQQQLSLALSLHVHIFYICLWMGKQVTLCKKTQLQNHLFFLQNWRVFTLFSAVGLSPVSQRTRSPRGTRVTLKTWTVSVKAKHVPPCLKVTEAPCWSLVALFRNALAILRSSHLTHPDGDADAHTAS